ncbi:MAG: glycosyltransferase [bacterium]|nr:glycosyltransferase [bacterium]
MAPKSTEYVSDVTIVIPTRNEAGVITTLLSLLEQAMVGSPWNWDVLVIDDSTDKTPEILQQLSQQHCWVKYIHRAVEERSGLGTAILLGMHNAQGKYVQLMDADGQHPPQAVRQMIDLGLTNGLELIMSTRYKDNGGAGGLDGWGRYLFSVGLRWLPRLIFPARLLEITDPLTGMFLVRKDLLLLEKILPIGWKISLEVMLFSKAMSIAELPIRFEDRLGGESKANFRVGLSYFRHLFSLFKRYYFPFQVEATPVLKNRMTQGGL